MERDASKVYPQRPARIRKEQELQALIRGVDAQLKRERERTGARDVDVVRKAYMQACKDLEDKKAWVETVRA